MKKLQMKRNADFLAQVTLYIKHKAPLEVSGANKFIFSML